MDTESGIWTGQNERRKDDRSSIYEQLGELRVRVTHIESSIAKIDHVSDQMETLIKQGQGIAGFMKILFYVVGPLVACVYWIKDHVR